MAIVFEESARGSAKARAAEARARELHRKAGEVWRAGDHRGATRYRLMAEEQERIAKAERGRAPDRGKNEAGEFHLGEPSDMAIIFENAAAPAATAKPAVPVAGLLREGGDDGQRWLAAQEHGKRAWEAHMKMPPPGNPPVSSRDSHGNTYHYGEGGHIVHCVDAKGRHNQLSDAEGNVHTWFKGHETPISEASLAGIQATAGNPAGPGPGNDSAPEIPDAGLRGGLPTPPQQPAFPQTIRPDVLRRAKLRAAAASQFGGATMVLGNMGAMAEQVGVGLYDLHYDNGQISAVVRSVGYMDLDESAPPSDEAEEWIMANKKEFKRRYGASWRSYLYGKAWKLFGKGREKPAVKREAGDAALEIYAGEDGALVFSALGESAAARDALLLEVSRAIAANRGLSVLSEGAILEVATGAKAKEKARPKSAWKMRRSLTDEEKAKLKVPHSEIGASVSHVPGHGYVVHTHRARSNFYKSPGAIPANSIHYISSTA